MKRNLNSFHKKDMHSPKYSKAEIAEIISKMRAKEEMELAQLIRGIRAKMAAKSQ